MRHTLVGPLLYVDADAILKEDIREYFSNVREDLAVYYFNENTGICSGTLYLNDTPAAYQLVDLWEKQMAIQPDLWDQKVLEDIVIKLEEQGLLTVNKLSPEYTFIYDISAEKYPNLQPKIEHLQASRDFGWVKKYRSRNKLSQYLMQAPLLSKATRIVVARHAAFNKRMEKLGLDIRLSLSDLINRG